MTDYPKPRAAMMWMLRLAAGVTYRELGEMFGVGTARAHQIVREYERRLESRRRWARGDHDYLTDRLRAAGAILWKPARSR